MFNYRQECVVQVRKPKVRTRPSGCSQNLAERIGDKAGGMLFDKVLELRYCRSHDGYLITPIDCSLPASRPWHVPRRLQSDLMHHEIVDVLPHLRMSARAVEAGMNAAPRQKEKGKQQGQSARFRHGLQ